MKNNRKNRKLNFIRNKNNLRLGKTKFYCVGKVSLDLNKEFAKSRMYNVAKSSLMKEYRLSLPVTDIERFSDGDDFIQNRITYRVILSKYDTL